jgi:tetratricopeptide (TPR) repeat protein
MLGLLSPGFTLWEGVSRLTGVARETQGGGAGWSYLFSATHLRDFFNEQFLIGPLSAFLFVPALLFALRSGSRWRRDPVAAFLVIAAGVYLAGSFATSEPLLGYARDWDLFAAAGVCFCAAAVYLVVSHTATPRYTRRLLAFALVLSLVHLAPWVAVNHSEALALERFKTLPLGAGRTEVVVANYYMRTGRSADAETWFKRALKANPSNVNAYYLLGVLYASSGHTETATQFIGRAVELRPDKPDYRQRYVQVLLDARRCREAVPQLAWLAQRSPGDFSYWQEVGQRMGRLGCGDDLAGIYAPVFAEADRLLTIDPGDLETCLHAGILKGFAGRPGDALEMYLRVLEADPESPAALFNAGLVLFELGRDGEARASLEKFVALYPNHEMAGYARKTLSQ